MYLIYFLAVLERALIRFVDYVSDILFDPKNPPKSGTGFYQ